MPTVVGPEALPDLDVAALVASREVVSAVGTLGELYVAAVSAAEDLKEDDDEETRGAALGLAERFHAEAESARWLVRGELGITPNPRVSDPPSVSQGEPQMLDQPPGTGDRTGPT